MKMVVLGTKNLDKLRELRKLMKGTSIRVLSLKDFPRSPAVAETGKTFAENAVKKARAYAHHCRMTALADDSGLVVPALGGKPGVYSARFAGPDCTYADNNRKLLRLLERKSGAARRAQFVCCVAIHDGRRPVALVRGECRGRIAEEVRGKNGFGYDPVFIPSGFKKTFAELSSTTKNKISHRARALRAAKQALLSR